MAGRLWGFVQDSLSGFTGLVVATVVDKGLCSSSILPYPPVHTHPGGIKQS